MIWNLLRSVTKTLLGLLLLGGAAGSVPFFIPPQSYHAVIERLLSDGLAREVHLRTLHYRLLPFPHIVGSGISIASHDVPGEAVIKQVDLWLDLNALLHGNIAINRAHFSGIAANQEFIEGFAKSARLGGGHAGSAPITVARVTASTVMVRDSANRLHGPFSFDGQFGGLAGFQRMRLAMEDESLIVDLKPLGGALEVHAQGHDLRLPGTSAPTLKRVDAFGVLTAEMLHLTRFSLQALGGWVDGDVRLHWSEAGSVVEGRSNVHNLSLSALRRWTDTLNLDGRVSGLLEFTATSQSLGSLPQAAAVVADLSVQNGSVIVGTPLFGCQQLNAQVTLTTHVTGKPTLAALFANAKLQGEATANDGHFLNSGSNFAFTQLYARGAVNRHTASVQAAEVVAYGGTLHASNAEISWQGTPYIQGQLQTRNVAVEPLLELLALGSHVSGAVTSDVAVTLTAREWRNIFDEPQIDGRATLQRVVLRNPGLDTLPVKPGSPWLTLRDVSMAGRYANNALNLTRVEIAAYDGTLTATDLTATWREGWRVNTRVQAESVPLGPVLARFTKQIWLHGLLSADAELTLTAAEFERLFDAPRLAGTATVTHGRVPRATAAASSGTDRSDWLDFERATINGVLHDKRVDISGLEVHAHGGKITSEGTSIDWTSGWTITAPIAVSAVQLGPLLRPFLTENVVTGELNAQLQTKLQAATPDMLADSLGLAGDFYISNGTVFKGDLGKAGTAVLTPTDGKGTTEFRVLSGSVVAKSGAIRVRNLHLESVALSAEGELRITPQRQLSGTLTVAAKGTGPFTIPLNIGGTVEDPRYSLSRGAMVGSAMGTTLFGPGFGTLIGMQTGRLLSVLGSLFTHNKENIERERAEEEL